MYDGNWTCNIQDGEGIFIQPKQGAYYTVWRKGMLEKTLDKVPEEVLNKDLKECEETKGEQSVPTPKTVEPTPVR